jgi:3-oxoadipate enol-lactonase
MGDLAGDVIAVLDRLDIERASVYGLSLGGMVGLTMAAVAPDRLDRLIAACVVAVPAAPDAWRDRAQSVLAGACCGLGPCRRAMGLPEPGARDRAAGT